MTSIFRALSEPAYAVMRIAFGLMFACHGAGKLFGAFGLPQAKDALMWVGGTVEFVGGLAIAVGLLTHLMALLASGQMFLAYLIFHQPNGLLPIQNRGVPALLFAFGFLYIMTKGPGIWSVDKS